MTLDTPPEPARDRYGRYLIVPEGGGKPVPMTRATTVAKTLEDGSGLMTWAKRQTARGMALRPDLVAAVATTDPDDKRRLNSLAEDAMTAAGSGASATVGTALHRATELADLGQPVPDMFAERVAEYRSALDAARVVVDPDLVECVLVLWEHQVAGTADRIVTVGGHRYVFDLKTGSSVDYPHSFAVQLATYAAADHIYDTRTETLRPMPDVDQERAIICHLPAQGGPCTLHWLDISAGRAALDHALWVRDWRKRRDLLVGFDVPAATNTDSAPVEAPETRATAPRVSVAATSDEPAQGDRTAFVVDALRTLRDQVGADQLAALWNEHLSGVAPPSQAATWTSSDMDRIERRLELPFLPTTAPAAPVVDVRAVRAAVRALPDGNPLGGWYADGLGRLPRANSDASAVLVAQVAAAVALAQLPPERVAVVVEEVLGAGDDPLGARLGRLDVETAVRLRAAAVEGLS